MTTDETMIRDMKTLQDAVTRLSTLIETDALRCPYREEIARSSNNRAHIAKNAADIELVENSVKDVEKRVNALDVSTARLFVMLTGSGGFGGALVALVNYLAQGTP